MDSHFFILLQAILRLILLCKAKGGSGKVLDIIKSMILDTHIW